MHFFDPVHPRGDSRYVVLFVHSIRKVLTNRAVLNAIGIAQPLSPSQTPHFRVITPFLEWKHRKQPPETHPVQSAHV